jgi:hypothetical protein
MKAVKAISILKNGAKYQPTQEEIDDTLRDLKNAVDAIARAYGALPADVPRSLDTTCIAQSIAIVNAQKKADEETRSEASASDRRIDAAKAALKRSPFAHGDVDTNIRAIPENQVTAYMTHLTARMCEKFETAEVLVPELET